MIQFKNPNASVYVPDGATDVAFSRTTHLAIAAHQDDVELMAMDGILSCYNRDDQWFTSVVTTDGAGSPRNGIYSRYTDEDMKKIRKTEQDKAAHVGDYSASVILGYTSAQVKDGANCDVIDDYLTILRATKPKVLYAHNLADKHDTHLGTVMKVIAAVRKLDKTERPEKFYGCEVWRDLDWVTDDEKVVFDVSGHPNLGAALIGVFDSQIAGGKRYDLAASGRRVANATYGGSHSCDTATGVNYGIDYSPLLKDDKLDPTEFILGYINRFAEDVAKRIRRVF